MSNEWCATRRLNWEMRVFTSFVERLWTRTTLVDVVMSMVDAIMHISNMLSLDMQDIGVDLGHEVIRKKWEGTVTNCNVELHYWFRLHEKVHLRISGYQHIRLATFFTLV